MNSNKIKELELNKRYLQECITSAERDNCQDLVPYWSRKVKTINRIINDLKHDKQYNNGKQS